MDSAKGTPHELIGVALRPTKSAMHNMFRLSSSSLVRFERTVNLDFWGFSESLICGIKKHVELPGPWPFGVFGRDPTEALIQYGTASVALWAENNDCHVILQLPEKPDDAFVVEMTAAEADRLGDRLGACLKQHAPPANRFKR